MQENVGEGSAIVIESENDRVLIDAANPMMAPKLISKLKNKKLSALIITHPHQDHIGGVFQILEDLPIKMLYDNGQPVDNTEPYRWYSEVFRKQNKNVYQELREPIKLGFDSFEIEVLSPEVGLLDSDWNKNSLVLRVQYGNFCALLMGDALKETEQELLKTKALKLHCPVVQIGHHGSKHASEVEFIKATKAQVGLISTNANNIRGYPARETIEAWQKLGTKVYQTSNSGTITVSVKKDATFSITTEHAK